MILVGQIAGFVLPVEVLERRQQERALVFELTSRLGGGATDVAMSCPFWADPRSNEARSTDARSTRARSTRARSSAVTEAGTRRRRRQKNAPRPMTPPATASKGTTHTTVVRPDAGGLRRMLGPYRLTR
jgi:hypothetical protein